VLTIINKQRFDDVGLQDVDGFYEYAYHGYNFEIASNERLFKVSIYDEEPNVAIVKSPTVARTCPEVRELLELLTVSLGCCKVRFYNHETGSYRPVDLETLAFVSSDDA